MNARISKIPLLVTGFALVALASAAWAGGNVADTVEQARKRGEEQSHADARQSRPAPQRAPAQRPGGNFRPQEAAPPPAQYQADRAGNHGGGQVRPQGNDRGIVGNMIQRNFGPDGGRGGYRGGPPRVVPSLPGGYRQYYWNGRPYYHYGGYWYRPYGSSFVVVGPPIGLFVSFLPSYYTSFWFGGVRYFYGDDTYYVYDSMQRGYVVSRSPYGDDRDDNGNYNDQADQDLYIYPSRGQSEQQQSDDRYECHRWASQQTGYDPVDANYDKDRRADYLRAMTACLTGRGYSVR